MAISPIDIQANMGHVHDVAKSTHAKNESLVQQQLFRDHEAEVESNRQKDTVQQNNEAEQSKLNPDAENAKERKKKQKDRGKDTEPKKENRSMTVDDPALGQRVDFTR